MKRRIYNIFAVILIMAAFCIPSFAANYYASDESGGKSVSKYIENIEINETDVSVSKSDSKSTDSNSNTYELTPSGNLTLIDDVEEYESDNDISQKQFLTVTTKSGNTFYIVVDRDGNEDNVYLLNLVDEADLMALINDEKVTYESTTAESTTEESTASKEDTKTTAKSSNSGKLILFVLVLGGGGFAVYWFKFRNKGKTEKENPERYIDEDEEEYDYLNLGENAGIGSSNNNNYESEDK